MGSDQGKRLGAVGRMDGWRMRPEDMWSPRSDPKHPDHADWKIRTDPNDADMLLLLASMRAHGTDEGLPVLVYSDGGRTCIAAGDRRQAACKIVNAERKAAKEKPLTLRALTTADPVLSRTLENGCRKGDPPMVVARRLRANMGAMATDPDKPETGLPAAAAACGVTLRDARHLLRCLSLPADIQAKVGAREDGIPIDVAASMAAAGSEVAAAAVDAASNPDGKVNGKKIRGATKAAKKGAGVTRLKAQPANKIKALADAVEGTASTKILQVLRWCSGEMRDPPKWIADALAGAAGEEPEAAE